MQVWRNCQVLSEQTSVSSAFLNAKYVLSCEQHFFIVQSGLSDIPIKCNRISEGLLYLLQTQWMFLNRWGCDYRWRTPVISPSFTCISLSRNNFHTGGELGREEIMSCLCSPRNISMQRRAYWSLHGGPKWPKPFIEVYKYCWNQFRQSLLLSVRIWVC
jgi:hypothetical protein